MKTDAEKAKDTSKGLIILAVLSAFIFLCVKCDGCLENNKIQGMMKRREFETVIDSFPKSTFVQAAKDSIAKQLFTDHEYEKIIWRFRESAWYDSAVQCSADTLLKTRQFGAIVFGRDNYTYERRCPDVYEAAVNAIADSLLLNEKYEELRGFLYRDTDALHRMEESPDIKRELERIEKKRQRQEDKAARERAREAIDRQKRMLESPSKFFTSSPLKAGMASSEVRSLIGSPDDINTTSIGGLYESQQWVYGGEYYDMVLLYFENGVLTSWQY